MVKLFNKNFKLHCLLIFFILSGSALTNTAQIAAVSGHESQRYAAESAIAYNAPITSPKNPLKFDNAAPAFVGFGMLLENMKLNPITGEFHIAKFQIKNLPFEETGGSSVIYGSAGNGHSLNISVKLKDKEIGRFAYSCSPNSGADWKTAELEGGSSSAATITEGGDLSLNFLADDKIVYTVNFEIIQITNKNSAAGFFISKPFETIGKLLFKNQSYGEADPNSELVFRFYHAALNPEDAFNDETPMSARLFKLAGGDEPELIGGTFETSIRHKSQWEMTDNIFFERPGQSYNYIKGADILNSPGLYYIGLIIGSDNYRYEFEVKDGMILTAELAGTDDDGAYRLKRKSVGVPKYESFRPVPPVAGIKDNIRLLVASPDGKTIKGCGEGDPAAFTDGQNVSISIYFNDDIKEMFAYRDTEYITTLLKDNTIIAQHVIYRMFGPNNFSSVAYNGDLDMKNDYFTHVFMEAMASLPPGKHNLTLVLELASGNRSRLVGAQKMVFTSVKDNPKYKAAAQKLKERLLMSESELAELRFLKYGGEDWALYENNCGRIVWLRQDEDREYYLYPGDFAKFDRNGGVLEQWNFGTLAWKSVNDFKASSTLYKLTANELATLRLNKVPDAVIDKLAPITGIEFKSENDFLAKAESLIGKDELEKYKTALLMRAALEIIKICN